MTRSEISSALVMRAFDAIPESCVLTDADQTIITVNRAFTALTGYTEQEVIGQTCRILQGPRTDPVALEKMRLAIWAGEVFRGCLCNYRKDGTTFWKSITITPLRDAKGQITHFVSVQRDDTEKHQIWEALREQSIHDPWPTCPIGPGWRSTSLWQLPERSAITRWWPWAISFARLTFWLDSVAHQMHEKSPDQSGLFSCRHGSETTPADQFSVDRARNSCAAA